MKLKCQPEDFRVEELPLVSSAATGRYAFYRLTKSNMGTIEAVEAICRHWNLAGRRVSYGGLKDRHAVTIQYLTIVDGPWQPMVTTNFELEPARTARPSLRLAALPRKSLRACSSATSIRADLGPSYRRDPDVIH